ncbi:MAG: DUF1491 family protein [Alphaproteobacteria bacterium]
MTEPRLKTGLWISAQVRLCDLNLIPAVIARRGDADSGQVLIRRNLLNGTSIVFARTSALEGATAWRRATGPDPVDDADAVAVIDREAGFDPDVWVLEIEDPDGRYELDAPEI